MQAPHDSGEIDQFRAPYVPVRGIKRPLVLTLDGLEQWVRSRPKCYYHSSLTCPICRDTERVARAVACHGYANLMPMAF